VLLITHHKNSVKFSTIAAMWEEVTSQGHIRHVRRIWPRIQLSPFGPVISSRSLQKWAVVRGRRLSFHLSAPLLLFCAPSPYFCFAPATTAEISLLEFSWRQFSDEFLTFHQKLSPFCSSFFANLPIHSHSIRANVCSSNTFYLSC